MRVDLVVGYATQVELIQHDGEHLLWIVPSGEVREDDHGDLFPIGDLGKGPATDWLPYSGADLNVVQRRHAVTGHQFGTDVPRP